MIPVLLFIERCRSTSFKASYLKDDLLVYLTCCGLSNWLYGSNLLTFCLCKKMLISLTYE